MRAGPASGDDLTLRLSRLFDNEGHVRKPVAATLVAASVWWLTHATGPVRAPAFREKLTLRDGEWCIRFGANTFHVGDAVRRCRGVLIRWMAEGNGDRTPAQWQLLRESLANQVRGSVSNHKGDRYFLYGSSTRLPFGAHAVELGDFLKCLGHMLDLPELAVYVRPKPPHSGKGRVPRGPTVNCEWCGAVVLAVRIAKHKATRCPKRPAVAS